ncbi:hypothetical protein [Levilactobacillus spicheri]|uniref:Surface layer protein A domain-containing protein n=2 Tax=Levilactobacillus spicheri TaxID=216463 RepID=A0ABQ0WN21_9LACO|nr:hypothetical protein [Levilactobacillus spicheri]KRL48733.1 hypothetical protein FD37_GL001195 [Levilactobacillus spicheri DSM 15429]GEO66406.1 hypothetical protein LSP04_08250 [Levilactobacillus spicheri]
MSSVLKKSLLVLTLVSTLNVPSLIAHASVGDTNTQSHAEAARELGISEDDFEIQTQKGANQEPKASGSRVNDTRIHFEFRTFNPYDQSWAIKKTTRSAYHLKSNTVTRPWYSAEAYANVKEAGNNGNISVSGKRKGETKVYKIYGNKRYKLTNYLVERYGNNRKAFILAWSHGDGSAWGYWHPDVQQ